MNQTINIIGIEEMMSKALANGSKAFSAFINKNVEVDNTTSLTLNSEFALARAEEYVVLISGLKGDIKGKSYLIFTKSEANEFVKHCLPSEQEDPEMSEAILLEFDNILTAAVVTTISNILKKNCYAYVPEIFPLKQITLSEFIKRDFATESLLIQTSAKFHIQDWECNPSFIWVFDDSVSKGE